MKKVLLILLIGLFSLNTFAQSKGVLWENGTLQEALNKAKSNKRGPNQVFLDCYTTWCGPCKMMAEQVFPTKEAGDYFNKNFVNIKIDMEKGEGIDLMKKYGVSAFPTFLVLDSDGNEVGRVIGGDRNLDNFIARVEKAKDPANSLNALLDKYAQGKNVQDAYAYLESCKNGYMDARIADFFNTYYKKMDMRALYSQKMWEYLSGGLTIKYFDIIENVLADKTLFENNIAGCNVNTIVYKSIVNDLKEYLMGELELSKEVVDKACLVARTMFTGNAADNIIIKAAEYVNDGNIDAAVKAFNNRSVFYSCSYYEISQLQRVFMEMKNVSEGEKARFVKNQAEYIKMMQDRNNMIWEKFKDVEIPEEKNTNGRAIPAMVMM